MFEQTRLRLKPPADRLWDQATKPGYQGFLVHVALRDRQSHPLEGVWLRFQSGTVRIQKEQKTQDTCSFVAVHERMILDEVKEIGRPH